MLGPASFGLASRAACAKYFLGGLGAPAVRSGSERRHLAALRFLVKDKHLIAQGGYLRGMLLALARPPGAPFSRPSDLDAAG